jgi:hypothetical protein
MARKYEKTGAFAKANQRKQMWVYADKWVELHGTIQRLEHEIKYWMIEAECDHNRWLRALEELDAARKQLETRTTKKKNATPK